MRERGPADDLAELVAPEAELARGRDRRVLLAQTAGGGVPWVREPRLAELHRALVQRLEAREWHVDLATHLEHLGRVAVEPLRERGDRRDVRGDVLTDATVAARRRLD
jgi:hypothetical protein